MGKVYIFGTGKGTAWRTDIAEQFFHDDHHTIVHDSNGFVLDESTQLPPEKVPSIEKAILNSKYIDI